MIGIALLLALGNAPTPVPIASAVASRVDAAVTTFVGNGRNQSPALAIAVSEKGKIGYVRGFGLANLMSRFAIGSVTKLVTAVSIMQLVERGRIDLDAKVATYVPKAPYANRITIRELLQHSSGLWNYGDDAFETGAVAKPTTPAAILALAASHPLEFAPGSKYTYSNTGYVLLGLVLEATSGTALADYERAHVFAPAAMHDTLPGGSAPIGTIVPGYMTAAGTLAPAFDWSWLYADGDLVSTAADLARFDDALMSGKLVSPQTFARMQADRIPGDGSAFQGLGLELFDAYGLHFVGHHGGLPGFESDDQFLPAQRLSVVVLSDSFDFLTYRARNAVLSELFPSAFGTSAATTPIEVPEDPAVTEKFRTALTDLYRGTADRSTYADAANRALTGPVLANASAQLRALGTIVSTKYVGTVRSVGATSYSYDVTFSGGTTLRWAFALSSTGKIVAISSTG